MASREYLVESVVREIHAPLITALQQEYQERFPMVCGPASIALSRTTAFRDLGVPTQRGGSGERLELAIGLFNPGKSSQHEPSDHAYIRYYPTDREVIYIDPTYEHIWGDPSAVPQPKFEKYALDEIDDALAANHSLYPFTVKLADELDIQLWGDEVLDADPMTAHTDIVSAMHDKRALAGRFTTDSGVRVNVEGHWGARIGRVLKLVDELTLGSTI